MPSDLELVVQASKQLEAALEKQYGATGRGLHEKLSSVEQQLPPEIVRNLRFIATMRNKIVHETDSEGLEDRDRFEQVVDEVMDHLDPESSSSSTRAPSVGYEQPTHVSTTTKPLPPEKDWSWLYQNPSKNQTNDAFQTGLWTGGMLFLMAVLGKAPFLGAAAIFFIGLFVGSWFAPIIVPMFGVGVALSILAVVYSLLSGC
jgi:hypothetical protein